MTNGRKPNQPAPSRSFSEVMALAKPRETEISICVAGDLAADADRLTAELDVLDSHPATSLSDGAERARLASELEEVRELMQEAQISFRFRALGKEFSDLIAAHPGGPGKDWDPTTLPADLIARCAIEPKMSLEESEQLLEALNEGQRGLLFNAAWRANSAAVAIPTSRAVSVNPSLSDAR